MHPILLLPLLLCILIYKFILYPIYLSPLSKIPNAHWLSPITSLWIHYRRYRGQEVSTVWEAVQNKGNVVRLGPKELLVNTYDGGVRTIYSGGFEKPNWYEFFINHGQRNIFTSLGKDHMLRRRRLTGVYSKTFVQDSAHVRTVLHTLLFDQYLPRLVQQAASGTPYGILSQNLAYGLDTVSAFMVGLPFGTRFLVDETARDEWLGMYLKSHPNDYMYWLLENQMLTKWLRNIGWNVVPSYVEEAHHWLEDWALQVVDKVEEYLVYDGHMGDQGNGKWPVVYRQLRVALTQETENHTSKLDSATSFQEQRLELASETLDQLVATRDVFGITFTYILWEISKNPEWQKRLQDELRSISTPATLTSQVSSMPTCKELESLPILNIVIKESMRLRGTLPVPNPRITPYDRKTTIGCYENIPGGVRTNSFAWCLHRDEGIYAEPDQWRPERWIRRMTEEGVMEREDMDRQFWAFGSGSRLCLGMSLAMEMIRYAVAGIYTNFTTTVVDDSKFCVDGHFVTGLPGEDLVLKFELLEPVDGKN